MKTEWLRRFIVVVDEGGLGAAADVLGMSQPVLSRQMSRLEDEINVKLFRRAPEGLRLTPAGESFYKMATQAVRLIEVGVNSARAQATSGQRLRVGLRAVTPTSEKLMSAFSEQFPDIEVVGRVFDIDDPTCGLANSETDVAFVHLPQKLVLESVPLDLCRKVAVMSASNPLGNLTSIQLDELQSASIVVPEVPGAPWVSEHSDVLALLSPSQITRVHSLLQLLVTVARGEEIGIVEECVERMFSFPGVVYIPLDGVAEMVYSLAWRPGAEGFEIESMRSVAQQLAIKSTPSPPLGVTGSGGVDAAGNR